MLREDRVFDADALEIPFVENDPSIELTEFYPERSGLFQTCQVEITLDKAGY